jgi:hypothetical protein
LRSPAGDESLRNFESSHKQKRDELISNFEQTTLRGVRQQVAIQQIQEKMELIDDTKIRRALSADRKDSDQSDTNSQDVVYPSSVSEADESDDSEDVRLPRSVMVAFREAHGTNLRIKRDTHRFTKTTNPLMRDKLQFILSESNACP